MSNNKKILEIPKTIRVSHIDIEELMAKMLDKSEEYENDEIEDLEGEFFDEFDVDSEQFTKIVEHLLPYSHLTKSALSESFIVGFADHSENVFIVKSHLAFKENKSGG